MSIRSGSVARLLIVIPALLPMGLAGCGKGGPKTHAVTGRVEVEGGEAGALAGSHVEAFQVADPNVRASGVIGEDGRFTLETLHAGTILKGAREGSYQARILLNDDAPQARRLATGAVGERYLRFDSAGLTFEVPSDEEIVLRVTPR
jgi:hypothetical protein